MGVAERSRSVSELEVESLPRRQPPVGASAPLTPGAKADPEWREAVSAFLADKRRAGCSQATLDIYTHCLDGRRIREWRAASGVTHMSAMDGNALRDLERALSAPDDSGRSLKPASVHVHHRTLHTFLVWCTDEGWAVGEAALRIAPPKLGVREPPALSAADETRILDSCANERDRYLVEFFLRTGLRLSEACALTLDDVISGPDGTLVRVRAGKGNKDRVVPLDSGGYKGSRRLRQYIDRVRPHETRRRELFLGLRRSADLDFPPLSPHSVKVMFMRLSAATGIHVHAHLLRHTFASRAIAAGVNPLTLQRVLGHTTLAMVSRYVHFDHASLARAWMQRSD